MQANTVGHTGASGWARLARPAVFDGEVASGRNYVLVDDFVGQGGTLANLRGYALSEGAEVSGAAAPPR
ncbi:MAG: phosphoribosyltransferase [Pseudomonadota bacterium]